MNGKKRSLVLWQAVCLCVLAVLAAALLLLPPLWQADFAPVGSLSELSEAAKIDLTSADFETLCSLPGVGEKRAAAILLDRTVNGYYMTLTDVCRVKGISQSLVESWEELACVCPRW